eukprot:492548-Pelagomonas_calceolata.AAC.2
MRPNSGLCETRCASDYLSGPHCSFFHNFCAALAGKDMYFLTQIHVEGAAQHDGFIALWGRSLAHCALNGKKAS